jgi:hypothetical protein
MRYVDEPKARPRRVRVSGRDDVGEVISEGVNMGKPDWNVYCVVVHFPTTGECAYYAKESVTTVDETS